MEKTSRRMFVKAFAPAIGAVGILPHVGHAESRQAQSEARNAFEYAEGFMQKSLLPSVSLASSGQVPVMGVVYGLATTVVIGKKPVGVAFIKTPAGSHQHKPYLWVASKTYTPGVGVTGKDMTTVVGFDLSNRYVEFKTTGKVEKARYIDDSEMLHAWQSREHVASLNEVAPKLKRRVLSEILKSNCSAYLNLNQGVLESGVPFTEPGRIGLWNYGNIKNRQFTDNELWSFSLPSGLTEVTLQSRKLDDPTDKLTDFLTIRRQKDGNCISCFFSNDVDPAHPRTYSPSQNPGSKDAANYWQLFEGSSVSQHPLFAKTVYGSRSWTPTSVTNDGEPSCQRSSLKTKKS